MGNRELLANLTNREIKFRVNDRLVYASFTQCLLCTNDYSFPLSPIQRRSFLNRNVLSLVHSLAAIFDFCFYYWERE